MGGRACTAPRARPPQPRDPLGDTPGGRGPPQAVSPCSCEPPTAGVGTAASCALCRLRNLSAPVTVMGCSGRNPASPARKAELSLAEPPPGLPAPLPAPLHTQELLGGPGELRPAAQPVPQPLQVEPRHLLAPGVGQGVEAAQLLQVFAVPGSPAVRRHDAVEGAVGAAAEGQTDHDVAAPVALQEPAACGESTVGGVLRDGRHPAGCSRRALTELHHGAGRAPSAIAVHGAAPPQASCRGFPLPSRPGRPGPGCELAEGP